MKNVDVKKKRSKADASNTEKTEKKVMTLSIEDLSKVSGGRAEMRQQGLELKD